MPLPIDKNEYRKKIDALKCCVIIPTYNNAQTIGKVLEEVLDFTNKVIVVNDGSTDSTTNVLASFSTIHCISYAPNKGKGMALRTGLKYAAQKGYRYAITIDSDGQHFADDIPSFIDKIEQEPDSFIIGARNLNEENMPRKNTFGNKFSNFWFRFQTGVALPDTQSGYRLYPIEKMKGTHYSSSKYEFEIEVMVKAAWKGINVTNVPVRVFYAEKGKRISHFRPFKDFVRISVLNTWLTILALLWFKPIRIFKKLSPRNIRFYFKKYFLDPGESVLKKSMAVAFGVFMGIVPIWGFQFASALLLAHVMKLNKVIVGLTAQISIPPMIPFILYGSFKTGQLVLGTKTNDALLTEQLSLEKVKHLLHEYFFSGNALQHLYEYLIGSMVFAVIMGVFLGISSYIVLKKLIVHQP